MGKIYFRQIAVFFGVAGICYLIAIMLIRLQLTHMAYSFEDLKVYERSLQEEQTRLRSQIAKTLMARPGWIEGFQEPTPEQIRRIP